MLQDPSKHKVETAQAGSCAVLQDRMCFFFFFSFFFLVCCMACRIFVPQPGIKPWSLAVKAPSPNHWTARKFPECAFYLFVCLFLAALGLRCCAFIAVRRLSLVVESGGYSSFRCAGFSVQWLLLLRSTGSRHAGFSSCGTWASVVVARGL